MSEARIEQHGNQRLARRYPINHPVLLTWRTSTGLLKRERKFEVLAELADISVTGVAVRAPLESEADQLEEGGGLAITLGGRDGRARVRQIRRARGEIILGLEFTDLSPGLQEQVYQMVAARRDRFGALASFWKGAR